MNQGDAQWCIFDFADLTYDEVVARSIIGCAAQPSTSSASRYKLQHTNIDDTSTTTIFVERNIINH